MKTRLLLLAFSALALGSCGTMYKSGQTPDDVYYSPGIEDAGYVRTEENRQEEEDGYVDVSDRYLRMKSSSQRWSAFDDDFAYWNNPTWNSQMMFNSWRMPYYPYYGSGFSWSIGVGNYWGNPWYGAGFGWNSWYNPFCPVYYGQPVVIINPKPVYANPRANGPRTYNLNTYNPNTGRPTYVDPKLGRSSYPYTQNSSGTRVRVFNNVNTNASGAGSKYMYSDGNRSSNRPRGGYINTDNSSGTRSSSPSRTFEPRSNSSGNSSSGSRSSGSSSSGSAPARSFPRGGGN
jgi:hypothetical protein